MKYKPLHYVCLFFCILLSFSSFAKDIIDDAFILKHLKTNSYDIDPDASAVILYENEYVHIALVNNQFERKRVIRRVIKILKEDALQEGNVHIYYPQNSYENYIADAHGTTYNLDGDKVVSTKTGKGDLMKKSITESYKAFSFSLPSVKVGSVIDYSYEEDVAFLSSLYSWHVQGKYPKLTSVYSMVYPKYIEFTSISHLRNRAKDYRSEDDAERGTDTFAYVSSTYESDHKSYWVRHNVEPYKEEPLVVNDENYKERLEMQITGIKLSAFPEHFDNSWPQLNKRLWKEDGLGKEITGPHPFFDAILDSVLTPGMTDKEKALAIFSYVRGSFECRERHYSYSGYRNLRMKEIWRKGKANIDEMNALLTAMLIRAGLNASPIIMSTTDDVSPNQVMPVIDRIDYMGCVVTLADGSLLLDASDKNSCAGMFPTYCYNGYSWILKQDGGVGVDLQPDLLKNKDIFSIKLYDFTDSTAKIDVIRKIGLVHSMQLRKYWADSKDAQKKEMAEFKRGLPEGIEFTKEQVDNINNPDTNLVMKFTGVMEMDKQATTIYMNTNFVKLYDKNPLPAATRRLPVEFPYKSEQSYYLTVVLPQGMEPDTLPPPAIISLDSSAMTYKRSVSYMPEIRTLTVSANVGINTTYFGVADYAAIREFFQRVIEDNNQVLVFKKKK
jgi:hypothetical protein